MSDVALEVGDNVSIQDKQGVWAIVGYRSAGEPHFEVQLGTDAATKHFENIDKLTLIEKAKKPEVEPGFYPGRSIMD